MADISVSASAPTKPYQSISTMEQQTKVVEAYFATKLVVLMQRQSSKTCAARLCSHTKAQPGGVLKGLKHPP